ncbi:hypothetical protein [uncultured Methanobacterium sp.]|uniref:hypothetical protein n=1 Tax=uncultured Methanobacterium sp. TaxID=176306 RepID=UPI002AA8B657|nr:hypothetical protein [uncultured Methanobacterium sp.]
MALNQAQKNKIKEIKAQFEREGMKEVHGNDGVWRPKIFGEVLRGIFLRMEPDSDNWGRNKYFFDDKGQTKDQDGEPIALKGEIGVFGSVVFDDKMRKIPVGAEVGIIYCGEQANPGKKSATKLFSIMSKRTTSQTVSEENSTNTMKKTEYPAAEELIKDCKTLLADEGNKNPTPNDIVNYATKLTNESPEQDTQTLNEVKILMAEEVKSQKKKEA